MNIWRIIFQLRRKIWRHMHVTQIHLFPVGLITKLVEYYTGIAEVMGLNPVQAWIFFRLKFHSCFSCVYNCDDHLCLHVTNILYKQTVKCQKRFSKGILNDKLNRGKFMVICIIVLQFLLVKCQSRPHMRFIVTMAL